jgi:hypothetical protein
MLDALGMMTKAELIDYARDNDIDVNAQSRKSDIIDTILEADNE